MYAKKIETPIGEMCICATANGICVLEFEDRPSLNATLQNIEKEKKSVLQWGENEHISRLEAELSEYFCGTLRDFTVPLDMIGTPFQIKVWEALRTVPYGMTKSYMDQAKYLNSVKGIRAVANANGKNKISIVVPCHRVIGANGSLTGYSGGIWRKRYLHDLEQNQTGIKPLIFS